MTRTADEFATKVPEVTLVFWIIKIQPTTLGQTGGDTVTMTWLHADENAHNRSYLIGTSIFEMVLAALVVWQTLAPRISSCPLLDDHRRLDHGPLHWRISPTALWASATPAARLFCFGAHERACLMALVAGLDLG